MSHNARTCNDRQICQTCKKKHPTGFEAPKFICSPQLPERSYQYYVKAASQKKKLYDVNRSRMFSLICDENTDVSNRQKLSMCVRCIDDSLNPQEDFLGFYELPNIASDTIVSAIKDYLTCFNLPLSDLRGQTYDGASNMLEERSGVAAKIKRVQPKAIEKLCHGHPLNLLVKDATKSNRLINDVLEIFVEITKLKKFSPKREQLLGAVNENFQRDNDDGLEQNGSLAKLCITRWANRANAFNKVINNFGPLLELWDICLGDKLDKGARSHILGCKSQMAEFRFTNLQNNQSKQYCY